LVTLSLTVFLNLRPTFKNTFNGLLINFRLNFVPFVKCVRRSFCISGFKYKNCCEFGEENARVGWRAGAAESELESAGTAAEAAAAKAEAKTPLALLLLLVQINTSPLTAPAAE
jgi:hypothetical protein